MVPLTPVEVVASERRCEKQMKDRDVGRNLRHWHTGGALHPSFRMVRSPGTPRWLGHAYSCMGGTWKEKAQREDEECFALMQPRHTAHAVIQDRSGRCRLETVISVADLRTCTLVSLPGWSFFPHVNHLIYSTNIYYLLFLCRDYTEISEGISCEAYFLIAYLGNITKSSPWW